MVFFPVCLNGAGVRVSCAQFFPVDDARICPGQPIVDVHPPLGVPWVEPELKHPRLRINSVLRQLGTVNLRNHP